MKEKKPARHGGSTGGSDVSPSETCNEMSMSIFRIGRSDEMMALPSTAFQGNFSKD
jgi:hypothetical protein